MTVLMYSVKHAEQNFGLKRMAMARGLDSMSTGDADVGTGLASVQNKV